MASVPQYLERVGFSDDCLFQTNKVLNKHNARVSSTENPNTAEEVPPSPEKDLVLCVMHQTQIIGPYFFIDLTGNSAD